MYFQGHLQPTFFIDPNSKQIVTALGLCWGQIQDGMGTCGEDMTTSQHRVVANSGMGSTPILDGVAASATSTTTHPPTLCSDKGLASCPFQW